MAGRRRLSTVEQQGDGGGARRIAWHELGRPEPGRDAPLEPELFMLFGCQIHTRDGSPARGPRGELLDAGEAVDDEGDPLPPSRDFRSALQASEGIGPKAACGVCKGAIRDRDPVTGRPADPYVCGRCLRTAASKAAAIHNGRPRPRKARRSPRPPRLTRRERLVYSKTAEGRAWLALFEARRRGDRDRAAALELGFQLYRDRLITAAELEARA